MLFTAPWAIGRIYRLPAREDRRYLGRVANLGRGQAPAQVNTAIARELVGYAWDIARRVPVAAVA